jgi:hypothetical protein
VGIRDGVRLAVAVSVTVSVMVGETVGVGKTTFPVLRKTKKTTPAPMKSKITSKARAKGKLMVISGMRGPCTPLDFIGVAAGVNVLPHTRQRVAFSLSLVPQVGQTFVFWVVDSGLISF